MKLLLCVTFLALVATVFGGALLSRYSLGTTVVSPVIGAYSVGLARPCINCGVHTIGYGNLGYGSLIASPYTTGIRTYGLGGYRLGYGLIY